MSPVPATTRFRGPAASPRSGDIAGGLTVLALTGLALGGLATATPWITFLAAGAGAGYSLSGSV